MSQGTHFRAPFSVKLPDGTSVEIVDAAGEVVGAINPETFAADTLVDTDKKIQFRDTGIFIQSGADGKITISADGSGADDITLAGTVTASDNITLPTDKKLLFRDTGLFIHSSADGKITISADGGGADDITLSGGVTVSGSVAMTGTFTLTGALIASVGVQAAAVARTATASGATTGTIADNTSHVTVTSADVNHIIILPTPTPGRKVTLFVGATGFELRSSAPATVSINGGAEADAESAIPANTTVYLTCVSATAWIGFQQDSAGVLAAVEVAAAA